MTRKKLALSAANDGAEGFSATLAAPGAAVAGAPGKARPAVDGRPQFMKLPNGRFLPYNRDVERQSPGTRLLHALPSSYVREQAYLVRQREAREKERQEYLAQFDREEEAKGARQRRELARSAAALRDSPAAAEAERMLAEDEHPGDFVLESADAEACRDFAQELYGVEFDEELPLEEMRREIALLAGLDRE